MRLVETAEQHPSKTKVDALDDIITPSRLLEDVVTFLPPILVVHRPTALLVDTMAKPSDQRMNTMCAPMDAPSGPRRSQLR